MKCEDGTFVFRLREIMSEHSIRCSSDGLDKTLLIGMTRYGHYMTVLYSIFGQQSNPCSFYPVFCV